LNYDLGRSLRYKPTLSMGPLRASQKSLPFIPPCIRHRIYLYDCTLYKSFLTFRSHLLNDLLQFYVILNMAFKPKSVVPAAWYDLKYTDSTTTTSSKPYITLPTIFDIKLPLHLTAFESHDGPAVQRILSTPSINLSLISPPNPYTLADAEWWIPHILSGGDGELGLHVIRAGDPIKGEFVGSVGLSPSKSKEPGEYELGYYLGTEYQGKGVIKAAVLAILSWAKETRQAKSVLVLVVEENQGSRRVVEGIEGFQPVFEGGDVTGIRKVERISWPVSKGGGKKNVLSWRMSFE